MSDHTTTIAVAPHPDMGPDEYRRLVLAVALLGNDIHPTHLAAWVKHLELEVFAGLPRPSTRRAG